jgi:hypothetical protein
LRDIASKFSRVNKTLRSSKYLQIGGRGIVGRNIMAFSGQNKENHEISLRELLSELTVETCIS